MHCEKKLYENVTKTLLGGKGSIGSKQDMKALHMRPKLWFIPSHNTREDFHMLATPYILNANEKRTVMELIKKLRTLSHYIGTIHKCLNEGKL